MCVCVCLVSNINSKNVFKKHPDALTLSDTYFHTKHSSLGNSSHFPALGPWTLDLGLWDPGPWDLDPGVSGLSKNILNTIKNARIKCQVFESALVWKCSKNIYIYIL